ncbi:MAG: M23 family metallopeptidase [Hyphomonadaceae bacterium JAD_PAG50586_4]|nr:MAG: M23 family metallopeptidase [Hyphomonadaceae bacterium JAD_PAG50586_4]
MSAILLVQAVLLGGPLVWLALQRTSTPVWALAAVGAAGLALLGVALTGFWIYPPRWALGLVGIPYAMLGYRVWRRREDALAPGALRHAVLLGGVLVWTSLGGALIWQGLAGRIKPSGDTLDLAAPLVGDGYCVISGGASPVLNFHRETLAVGKQAYRGQSYGADFIARSPLGFRTTNEQWWRPAPTDPQSYRIFGAPIVAPCAGEVATARDGVADQPAGVADLSAMAGNHVVLSCGGYEVLLAHLRQGSVSVATGQQIQVGDALGEVGNTGATDEPHLHVSVQRAIGSTPSFGGDPVHLTFNGRYLARGDCL